MEPGSSKPACIGRYQIQRVLGGGAMGIVFLAYDPLLKRAVAIKTVREGTEAKDLLLERFRREAEVSARLSHPNIITVFDVGEDPEVGPFLAMEYVEGTSLAALIHDGIALESALRLLIQLMGALMAAEAAGIAHRDVKPENVLVDKQGRVKLMDFGIARSGESRLTQGGVVFGTPSYTAPELLVGADASPVTDRYAFAVTAFELFTGTLPFQGRTVGTTLYRIVHEAPELPETLSPRLRKVFETALAKSPKDRPPDLPTFVIALVDASDLSPETQESLLTLVQENPTVRSRLARSTRPLASQQPEKPAASHPRATDTSKRPSRLSLPWAWIGGAALFLLAGAISLAWMYLGRPRRIDVFTSPPGAEVKVDGFTLGRTPLTQAQIRGRSSLLRIERRGYQPATRTIGPKDSAIYFTLEPLPWTLSVVTDPPEAEILLDDQPMGRSPLPVLTIPAEGEHTLTVRLEGFEEWRAKLDRDAPFPETIRLSPEPPATRPRRR